MKKTGRRYIVFIHYIRGIILAAMCSFIILLSGCGTHTLKQYVRPDFDIGSIKTIAVLPLDNYTSDNYADEKTRNKINIELLSRDINIIEPGEIVLTLRELKIRSVDTMRKDDIVSLGEMLNADAVITGSVEAFGISKGITVSYPEVSVHLMMYDAATGDIIWSIWNTTGGASFGTRHFGTEGRTLDKVSEMVIKEAFSSLY